MRNQAIRFVSLGVVTALVAGCAGSMPPPELVSARSEYAAASKGPAASLKPADLLTAKQELDRAERLFADEGDAPETRDAAYVADRKARLATASAQTTAAAMAIDAANKALLDTQAAQLAQTKDQLQASQGALKDTQGALNQTAADLERERRARAEAERKLDQAMADIQKIAAVKKEERGTVITLPGGVLFATDKYEVQGSAMPQLDQVADALIKASPDSTITVEGHTDAQGQPAYNKDLSQKRASAVAAYLVSRGIARDRVTAVGIGQERPVASNSTIDGRAQNRRVEIIVSPPKSP
jgi:outer membrane protein OmpA-like peptidoglycan-associated protein